MTERILLGKISRATFGYGGYDDAMIGLSLTFDMNGSCVADFNGTWASHSERGQWTVEDQRNHFADSVILLRDTLRDAKRKHVGELVGVPVEVTLNGNLLRSWRVLTEVI